MADQVPGTGHRPGERALPTTVAEARARVSEHILTAFPALEGGTPEPGTQGLAEALLVTSELVTNAIRHGGGLTGFDIVMTEDGVVLNVADSDPQPPVTTDPATRAPGQPGGFGWPLVCRLAQHVTLTPRPDGKEITVLVPLTAPAAGPPTGPRPAG
ncbi:ATP-binding protein [Streptomyces sp. NPDC049916]|uniref:ATP-binding protein n=1 Tax=Streptomyces sp. NPDC049916 TaxID=3155156 RepID=UPI00341297E3